MTTPAWKAVAEILDQASSPGPGRVFPAAGLLVAHGERILFEHASGVAGPSGHEVPCDETTVFDLASLTKPLVTAALTLDLIARGRLHFDTTVAGLLPAFAAGGGHSSGDREGGPSDGVAGLLAGHRAGNLGGGVADLSTGQGPGVSSGDRGSVVAVDPRRATVQVRHLLHHDSGLPAYQRYFEAFPNEPAAGLDEAAARRARMFDLAVAEPLEREPGSSSVYSDIGFLVLGALIEAVEGARIDELAASRIFEPLAVEEAWYVPVLAAGRAPAPRRRSSGFPLQRTAPTGTCEWRGREIHGEVQDENAWAMGGVASHAGLFATVRAVHRLVLEWVRAAAGRGLLLDRRLVTHSWARASGVARGTWALGWDTPSPGASSAGSRVGPSAVGHLGYTGTSIWIDRNRGLHVVLLTNRIACGRNSDAIRALRPRLHDAVFAAVDAERGGR